MIHYFPIYFEGFCFFFHTVNEDHVLMESGALALCSYSIQYDTRTVHFIILELYILKL